MNMFSHIKYGKYLNADANFKSFWTTMMTIFRCVLLWSLSLGCCLICLPEICSAL